MSYQNGNIIYIISCKEYIRDKKYKIGKTKNLNSRLRSYKTGFPSEVKVIYYKYIDNMDLAEKLVHHFFKDDKCNDGGGTEWFKIKNIDECICCINNVNDYLQSRPTSSSSYSNKIRRFLCCCFR